MNTGGAVYSALANTGISVSDSIFKFNEAGMYGGALYIGEQHRRTISVLNTVMEYNMAFRAGGKSTMAYMYTVLNPTYLLN